MPLDGATFPSLVTTATRRLQRRDDDQRLAALLVEGGVAPTDVYALADDEDVEDCVLSDDGEWAEEWGRPLRRWSGFPSQAHAAQARRTLFYTAFATQRSINSVQQIRISAPVCRIPLPHLRRVHAEASRKISERLRYGLERYAPGITVDLITAEVVRDGAGCVYLHFHLVARGGTPEELAALRKFWTTTRTGLPTGWEWWDDESDDDADEDDRAERHPAALVNYVSKSLAAALDESEEWTPAELAELFRQTRGLAMVRAKGEFARWLGDLDRAGLTVRRNTYGAAVVVPKRPAALGIRRHRDKLFQSVGFSVLRRLDEYNFGDGIRRRAWLVRANKLLTIKDIVDAYVFDEAHLTDYAPIPESRMVGQSDGGTQHAAGLLEAPD